jgi:hypothetical protein
MARTAGSGTESASQDRLRKLDVRRQGAELGKDLGVGPNGCEFQIVSYMTA